MRITMATIDCTTALGLLGHTADFVQFMPCFDGPELIHFRGSVMAVHLPAAGTGVEQSLLIQFEGYGPDAMDYVETDTIIGFVTLPRTL
jgi:hypothetical protein